MTLEDDLIADVSPDDVRAYLPSRVAVEGEQGDLLTATYLPGVAADVQLNTTDDLPAQFYGAARALAAYGTAAYIERHLYPDTGYGERDLAAQMLAQYQGRLRTLRSRVTAAGRAGVGGSAFMVLPYSETDPDEEAVE